MLAVCLQHEMDHLEGILFIDHLSRLKREMILRKIAKRAARSRARRRPSRARHPGGRPHSSPAAATLCESNSIARARFGEADLQPVLALRPFGGAARRDRIAARHFGDRFEAADRARRRAQSRARPNRQAERGTAPPSAAQRPTKRGGACAERRRQMVVEALELVERDRGVEVRRRPGLLGGRPRARRSFGDGRGLVGSRAGRRPAPASSAGRIPGHRHDRALPRRERLFHSFRSAPLEPWPPPALGSLFVPQRTRANGPADPPPHRRSGRGRRRARLVRRRAAAPARSPRSAARRPNCSA